jgi:Cu/Ag efflux protein CusF
MIIVILSASSAWTLLPKEKVLEGTVKNVQANTLIVLHQTKQSDQLGLQEVVFAVNQETQLEGIASLENLKQGDQVEVKYEDKENQRIALSVTKISEEDRLDKRAL